MQKNNKRIMRINDEIARETANIIRFELSDPRLGGIVSVLHADTTVDLKTCKISVSILGDETQQEGAMAALKSASGFIRKRIAEKMNLRHTPELTFLADDSIAHAMRMQQLIAEANRPDNAT